MHSCFRTRALIARLDARRGQVEEISINPRVDIHMSFELTWQKKGGLTNFLQFFFAPLTINDKIWQMSKSARSALVSNKRKHNDCRIRVENLFGFAYFECLYSCWIVQTKNEKGSSSPYPAHKHTDHTHTHTTFIIYPFSFRDSNFEKFIINDSF